MGDEVINRIYSDPNRIDSGFAHNLQYTSEIVRSLFGSAVGPVKYHCTCQHPHRHLVGKLYIGTSGIAFYSNLFGIEHKALINYQRVAGIGPFRNTGISVRITAKLDGEKAIQNVRASSLETTLEYRFRSLPNRKEVLLVLRDLIQRDTGKVLELTTRENFSNYGEENDEEEEHEEKEPEEDENNIAGDKDENLEHTGIESAPFDSVIGQVDNKGQTSCLKSIHQGFKRRAVEDTYEVQEASVPTNKTLEENYESMMNEPTVSLPNWQDQKLLELNVIKCRDDFLILKNETISTLSDVVLEVSLIF